MSFSIGRIAVAVFALCASSVVALAQGGPTLLGTFEAWESYKIAWADARVRTGLERLAAEPSSSARANQWVALDDLKNMPVVV